MTSITDKIRSDHDNVIILHQQFNSTNDIEEKQRIFHNVVRELSIHADAEESVLYPVIERTLQDGKIIADKDRAEHAELKRLLYELDGQKVTEQGFSQKFSNIIGLARNHITDEENEQLPYLEKTLSQEELEKLGRDFDKAKKMAPSRPHPSAPQEGIAHTAAGLFAKPVDAMLDMTRDFK